MEGGTRQSLDKDEEQKLKIMGKCLLYRGVGIIELKIERNELVTSN